MSQGGITTSGIDRHGDATVTEPDILQYVQATSDGDEGMGCFEQESSVADAISRTTQGSAGRGAGELQ